MYKVICLDCDIYREEAFGIEYADRTPLFSSEREASEFMRKCEAAWAPHASPEYDVVPATREDLADELAAAGEYTGDWKDASMDDLRERVKRLMDLFRMDHE